MGNKIYQRRGNGLERKDKCPGARETVEHPSGISNLPMDKRKMGKFKQYYRRKSRKRNKHSLLFGVFVKYFLDPEGKKNKHQCSTFDNQFSSRKSFLLLLVKGGPNRIMCACN